MRSISVSDGKPIKLTPKLAGRLKEWLSNRHEKAKNARTGLETVWRTALRMYQGSPVDRRWLPFDNAPRIEITIGAQCSDSVCAQAQDLIFQVKPPVTLRSRKDEFEKHSEALQDLTDWGVESGTWRFRPAVKTGIIDVTQLGTKVYYIPWIKTVRKTDLKEIVDFGPQIHCVAPENFILPANSSGDIQADEFCTMRERMSKHEAWLAGSIQGWKLDDPDAVDMDSSGVSGDRFKQAGINGENPGRRDLSIGYTWGYFDVDNDDIAEDIFVVWNMVTGNPLKLTWNRYDCRPFVMTSYQDRAHVAYGIGVMEMVAPFEEEATEIRNNRVWNMMMRNQMMFQGPEAAMTEVEEIYNGKYIPNDQGKIEVMPMGEPDNTPIQAEMISLTNAQQRVGVNELQASSRLGGRTPGITALSALQQANRRFTPAFDNMRYAVAGAVIQCLYRIQERVRAEDEEVIAQLGRILGEEKSQLVIDLFKKDDLELHDAIDIQLTASSVSVNREADRQNMVMLEGIWEKYIQAMTMFAQAKANPPFHGAGEEADKAAAALNKMMMRILRTFDQISDVEGYLIDLDDIPMGQVMPPELAQMVGAQNQPQNGAPPQGPVQ